MKKKRVIKNLVLIPLYVTLILLLMVLAYAGYKKYQSNNEIKHLQSIVHVKKSDGAAEKDEKTVLPKYQFLYEKNSDLVGWLTISGIGIDYPVMYKDEDNDYYLSRNFEEEYDENGLLVLDKRCDSKEDRVNTLIHGHNMATGEMFGALLDYADYKTYKKNPYIKFDTLYEEQTYEIFAVFRSTVNDANTTDFKYFDYIQIESEKQYDEYVEEAIKVSLYDTKIRPKYGENLITLSTCSDDDENGRFVVVGRKVE